MPHPTREAGFTLIEVIISLVLFALIAAAGVALVESVLGIQHRTAGRLERLGDMQRAMFIVANDLGQINDGPVSGDAGAILLTRPLSAMANLPQPIAYALAGDALVRTIGKGAPQPLLTGVSAARWRYFHAGDGWLDRWPPEPKRQGDWPEAISLDATLVAQPDRPGGTLRRIVVLPVRP